ncbi:protocatechuate 3,4-dioxygenase subunit alpha [Protaetiibacter intestinalis]|uniref:Protocatechuate 3,4-dioxygenase subunit alpha n=1 Tax=Protaetiibacter intestinalis TaxID=2419774 RepID=A0A387BAR1_9MICO|nr:protocatechuate 3,4-dioxygenase subunit alpha [Protaetiibacter intestinalis]AYF98226.1 protocatechuate 3,4-dioxygenase subunit alpha [Protaetiibacter intestinalis]
MSTEHVPTPGQTVGPFFGFGLPFARGNELVEPGTPGAVRLHGRVVDGAGEGIPDALIELWHAAPDGTIPDATGHLLRDGTFAGFGRAETDRTGGFWFRTLEPGPTEPGAAPFIAVAVFARGLLDRLFTRAYLPGEAAETDPFLARLDPERRDTLVAVREDDGSLRFDIRLQGEGETVFLEFDA